jgi:hypothetical protein
MQMCIALVACVLWIGLALPGLSLLPGLNALGDQSIAISLQSALLGIDGARSQSSIDAARALGLVGDSQLLASQSRANSAHGQLDAQLSVGAQQANGDASSSGSGHDATVPTPPTPPTHVTPAPPHAPHAPHTPQAPQPPKPGPPAPNPPGGPSGPTTPPTMPAEPGLQAISFTSAPPTSAAVGGGAYTVTAVAPSGLPVSLCRPKQRRVCAVSGTTVQFLGPGVCTIDADQLGDVNFQAAARVQLSFTVFGPSRSTQTINFASTAPTGVVVGDPAYVVVAAASSGLPVALSTSAGRQRVHGTGTQGRSTGPVRARCARTNRATVRTSPLRRWRRRSRCP